MLSSNELRSISSSDSRLLKNVESKSDNRLIMDYDIFPVTSYFPCSDVLWFSNFNWNRFDWTKTREIRISTNEKSWRIYFHCNEHVKIWCNHVLCVFEASKTIWIPIYRESKPLCFIEKICLALNKTYAPLRMRKVLRLVASTHPRTERGG